MSTFFGAFFETEIDASNIKIKLEKIIDKYRIIDKNVIHDKHFFGFDNYKGDDISPIRKYDAIIVFDGEIYNTKNIINRFFRDEKQLSDNDVKSVILLLYKKFGLNFPKYLNGIFSIVIYDRHSNTLHLCRDHVGTRPLYYSIIPTGVLFSSTINSLLSTGFVSTKLSIPAINQYFASKALSPPATMYSAVSAVPAARVISINQGNVSEYDYWNLHQVDVDENTSETEYVEELKTIIHDAIIIRANYSTTYGTVVSGGLDTGIITATLSNLNKNNPLDAFSVAFDEGSFSDASLQKLMVDEFSLRHHQAILGPEEFVDVLCDSVSFLDSPVNDIAFVGMSKVFELAKQNGFNVVFEGEGPDEIFPAGNTHGERGLKPFLQIPGMVRHNIIGSFFQTMPLGDSYLSKISRLLTRIGMDDAERQLTWRTYFHNKLRCQLLNNDWYDSSDPYVNQREYILQCENQDTINHYQYGLIKTFLTDNLLFKDERMAARHGIINRAPLIDYRLVELALKIPSYMQLQKPSEDKDGIKLLYKKALQGQIPDEIIRHKKVRGFSHPTSGWFRNELKDFVHDILLGETTRQRGIFNMKYVDKLVNQHLSGSANYDFPLNSLLVFELWMRNNYDRVNICNV